RPDARPGPREAVAQPVARVRPRDEPRGRGADARADQPDRRHQRRDDRLWRAPRPELLGDVTMAYDLLLLEREPPLATITLNRPDKRNALSHALRVELAAAVAELDADDAVSVVVLTGAG